MGGLRREVLSLNLESDVIGRLLKHGYRTIADLKDVTPLALARQMNVTEEWATEMLRFVMSTVREKSKEGEIQPPQTIPSSELLQACKQHAAIISFCRTIDTMLGGGIRRGELTEICGAPGSAKTQFSLQLCMDVQIPKSFGGCGGQALFIDAEGSFMADRAHDIAGALLIHLQRIAKMRKAAQLMEDVSGLTVETILSHIHVVRVLDPQEQLDILHGLWDYLEANPEVALVVVDSLAFHLRNDLKYQTHDNISKARLLNTMAAELNQLADSFNVAVVVINQMTTRIGSEATATGRMEEAAPTLVPTLGETWTSVSATRMLLHGQADGSFSASLLKSPFKGPETVSFTVNNLGVRDIPSAAAMPGGNPSPPQHQP